MLWLTKTGFVFVCTGVRELPRGEVWDSGEAELPGCPSPELQPAVPGHLLVQGVHGSLNLACCPPLAALPAVHPWRHLYNVLPAVHPWPQLPAVHPWWHLCNVLPAVHPWRPRCKTSCLPSTPGGTCKCLACRLPLISPFNPISMRLQISKTKSCSHVNLNSIKFTHFFVIFYVIFVIAMR
jgi:hypothetical protein